MEAMEFKQRGYDDTAYLQDMAAGMITRRFSSVEEAAKAVLGEDSGSNVDRLRRKFREQGWYERGLNEYVEAEIARRSVPSAPIPSVATPSEEDLREVILSHFADQFRPTALIALMSVYVAVLSVLAQFGVVPGSEVTAATVPFAFYGMLVWAWQNGKAAEGRLRYFHVAGLALLTALVIKVFAISFPDENFSTGSAPGSLVLCFGGMLIGAYAIAAVENWGRKTGRYKNPEFAGLSLALMLLSGVGLLNFVKDASSYERLTAIASEHRSLITSDTVK